jgi:hypothetical protein
MFRLFSIDIHICRYNFVVKIFYNIRSQLYYLLTKRNNLDEIGLIISVTKSEYVRIIAAQILFNVDQENNKKICLWLPGSTKTTVTPNVCDAQDRKM